MTKHHKPRVRVKARTAPTPTLITEANIDLEVPEHLVHIGLALRDQNELEPAKACLLRAIGLQHDHADAHLGLGEVLLANGEYTPGFMEYQWRMRTHAGQQIKLPGMTSAPWNGMALPDSDLLLISDQGYGDGIQFIRYAALIKKLSLVKNIFVACGVELNSLFAKVEGVDATYSKWNDVPPHAVHALLSDLPYLLHTELDTVPWDGAYIHAPGDKCFSHFMRPLRRVGLVWSGRPTPGNDRLSRRSMPLTQLRPLMELPDRQFVSLQTPLSDEDAHVLNSWGVPDWGSEFTTFEDTTEALRRVDAVVTIDTAVAHLAGAMGMTTFLMAPYSPDWRWIGKHNRTPWYPHTRVFRQQSLIDGVGDWGSAIAPICALLGP